MARTRDGEARNAEARWVLTVSYGIMAIVVGVDKFAHVLAEWSGYVAPVLVEFSPLPPHWLMYGLGVVEVILGVLLFSPWARPVALLVGLWLLAVTANVTVAGFYDVALRDLVLAGGAFALAFLHPGREDRSGS